MQKYAKTLDDMKGCKQPVKFNGFHIPLGKPIQITKINRFTESFDHRNVGGSWMIYVTLRGLQQKTAGAQSLEGFFEQDSEKDM